MTSLARRNSSIHKLQEHKLKEAEVEQDYEILKTVQDGWKGKIFLAEHRETREEIALKAIQKCTTNRKEFFKEFHYNYFLSPHKNILNAYDVSFESRDYYVYAQEYAVFGDLTSNFSDTGLGEMTTKIIVQQIASALDFMHSKGLAHRAICMDNILVFTEDFSEVKLCDFGLTRKEGDLVKKALDTWLPYTPPEIVDAVVNEGYYVDIKHDVWQFGILIYVLLTGGLSWQKADVTDPYYLDYLNWRKRKILKTPKRFSNFTSRAIKMMKRLLEPKLNKRFDIIEVYKYVDDKWLLRSLKKASKYIDNQSLCYSNYSFHSLKPEKDKILHALKAHGIETTVNRDDKRKRIHDWIELSLPSKPLNNNNKNNENNENNIVQNINPKSATPTKIVIIAFREQNYDRSQIIGPSRNEMVIYDQEDLNPDGIRKLSLNSESNVNQNKILRKKSFQSTNFQDTEILTSRMDPLTISQKSSSAKNSSSQIYDSTELDNNNVPSKPRRTKRGRLAARSHSARVEKSEQYLRSRSLARDQYTSFGLQRSKTEPKVDEENSFLNHLESYTEIKANTKQLSRR